MAISGADRLVRKSDLTIVYQWDSHKPLEGVFVPVEEKRSRAMAVADAQNAVRQDTVGGKVANTATQKNLSVEYGFAQAMYDAKTDLLVLQELQGGIRVIRPRDGSLVRKISAYANNMDVDNGYLAVGGFGADSANPVPTVTVYDLATGKVVQKLTLPVGNPSIPGGMSVALDGDTLFFANTGSLAKAPVYYTKIGSNDLHKLTDGKGKDVSINSCIFLMNRADHELLIQISGSPNTFLFVDTATKKVAQWTAFELPSMIGTGFDGFSYVSSHSKDWYTEKDEWHEYMYYRFQTGGSILNVDEASLFTAMPLGPEDRLESIISLGMDGVDAALITSLENGKVTVYTLISLGNKKARMAYCASHVTWCGGDRVLLWTSGSPNACLLTLQ